jgi:hypothetical protein
MQRWRGGEVNKPALLALFTSSMLCLLSALSPPRCSLLPYSSSPKTLLLSLFLALLLVLFISLFSWLLFLPSALPLLSSPYSTRCSALCSYLCCSPAIPLALYPIACATRIYCGTRLRDDRNTIAKRLQSNCLAIARRSQSDCKVIARRM